MLGCASRCQKRRQPTLGCCSLVTMLTEVSRVSQISTSASYLSSIYPLTSSWYFNFLLIVSYQISAFILPRLSSRLSMLAYLMYLTRSICIYPPIAHRTLNSFSQRKENSRQEPWSRSCIKTLRNREMNEEVLYLDSFALSLGHQLYISRFYRYRS
jgi:hypothetical protein